MFKKKQIKELTDKQKHDIERIKVLREYAHQESTEHNFGRITDAEYFKEMSQVNQEIEWIARANAFDEMMGNPMKELEDMFK